MKAENDVHPADGAGPVLVLGMGRSGMAAARLLLRQKRPVTVIDAGDNPALAARATGLRAQGARVLTGRDAVPPPEAFAFAVVSPGVPLNAAWMIRLAEQGLPLISELELGWRATRSRILAVTGSNGKSTLVALCGAALAAAGRTVRLGGNFGDPLCQIALEHPDAEWLIVEVSSFQMETSPRFHPEIGIWLNLFPNHLDRHGDMASYAALKARLFRNMGPGDQAVLFEGVERVCPAMRVLSCRKTFFGVSSAADVCYRPGQIVWQAAGGESVMAIDGTPFDNMILGPAAAAATAAVLAAGLDPACVVAAAGSHQRLAHRQQPVACVGGVQFINDAKATNLAALSAALALTAGPVRLLAGGRLQETDVAVVIESLRKRVVSVYLWGEASAVLARAWSAAVPCREYRTLEQAVTAAWRDARPGETVLLSPGCSSRDQYQNFAQRGEAFLAAVSRIQEGDAK